MYDRRMDRVRILTAVRLATVGLVVAAIVVQAVTLANAGRFDATRFFAFFTIQSNLIGVAAFVWLLSSRGKERSRGLELLRGAAAVYLTVTFIVVIFMLSDVDDQLQLAGVEVVLHKLFPIVIVFDWILDPPMIGLRYRDAIVWLAYPLAWTGVTLVRGAIDGWYPYPFLDPAHGGYGTVALVVVAITLGFVLIAAIMIAIGNARRRASPESAPGYA
jgi:hypothetical protein